MDSSTECNDDTDQCDESSEFKKWYNAYERYIFKLWDIYQTKIAGALHVGHEASFDDFVYFVYEHSSGYISEYL